MTTSSFSLPHSLSLSPIHSLSLSYPLSFSLSLLSTPPIPVVTPSFATLLLHSRLESPVTCQVGKVREREREKER